MTVLTLDFETFSEVDLRKVGAEAYAEHPSTRVLMLGWAVDDGPVDVWEPHIEDMPPELWGFLVDKAVEVHAWNKSFEYAIFKHKLGVEMSHSRWRDPMVLAHSLSFPGALDKVGKIVKLKEDKQKSSAGKRLITYFCKPQKPTKDRPWTVNTPENSPEKWAEFVGYCRQDVESERHLWGLMKSRNMPAHEWENWFIDQEINQTGLPIDLKLVDNALALAAEEKVALIAEAKEITGLGNPNSQQQLLGWLRDRGYPYQDISKVSLRKALDQVSEEVRRVLVLRSQWAKTSTAKFEAFRRTVNSDGRFRNAFQFAGAGRTWRWAGRAVQLQNLPRPISIFAKAPEVGTEILRNCDLETVKMLYDESPMDLLSSAIRSCIRAPAGYRLVVSDLNAIENRVLGWTTGCKTMLDVFRDGLDPYKSFGVHWLKKLYDEITKAERTLCKPAVLGAGYMLSGGEYKEATDEYTGLWGYADSMGITMTEKEAKESVAVFRETYSEVPDFWWAIMRAAKDCLRTGDPTTAGPAQFVMDGQFLKMRLPSGRFLHYHRPKMLDRKTPWGEVRPALTYMGLNNANQWVRLSTHPGKLTENFVQAVARDVLMEGIKEARNRGFTVVGHVHDEVITLVPDDSPLNVDVLSECLCPEIPWAKDLPLGAEGYESIVYRKD